CADDERVRFDIAGQAADIAILEFARQARLPVLFPSGSFQDFQTNAVRGEYCVEDALRLLLEGSPVQATLDGARQLVIRLEEAPAAVVAESDEDGAEVEAEAEGGGLLGALGAFFGRREAEPEAEREGRVSPMEEITVTGSRIRRTDGM